MSGVAYSVTRDLVTAAYLEAAFHRVACSLRLWMLVMQAPVYAGLVVIFLRLGL